MPRKSSQADTITPEIIESQMAKHLEYYASELADRLHDDWTLKEAILSFLDNSHELTNAELSAMNSWAEDAVDEWFHHDGAEKQLTQALIPLAAILHPKTLGRMRAELTKKREVQEQQGD